MSALPFSAPRPIAVTYRDADSLYHLFGFNGKQLIQMGCPCRVRLSPKGRRMRVFEVAAVERWIQGWRSENE